MLEKLLSFSTKKSIKVVKDPSRLRPIDAELQVPNIEKFSKYLIFSNIDLTSEVVKEYPSLQGLAGGFYAKKFGFPKDVQDAFSNQY